MPREVRTDVALVRCLLAEQFPHWADLPVQPVRSYGTDHHIYRLGRRLVARLPRVKWAVGQAAKEAFWLPRLAPHLPLQVPVPVAVGRPGGVYPYPWSVHEWLPGANANGSVVDLVGAAVDLATFVTALRRVDTAGAPDRPTGGRGCPLVEGDDQVRRAVAQLGDRVDSEAILRSWQESLAAPVWDGDELWVHGDLLPGNLLVLNGRLFAVIDFGSLNVGDPACDLQPAWSLFTGESRARYRAELVADDASWLRGRGWSLLHAVCAMAYCWDTNPAMVRQSSRVLTHIIADPA